MANFFVGFPANATSIGSPFQRPSLTFSGMRAVMGDASAASPSVQDILNMLKLHTVHIRFGSGLLVATCICAPTVSTTTATVAQQVQKESTPKLCLAAQCAWPKDIAWPNVEVPTLPVSQWHIEQAIYRKTAAGFILEHLGEPYVQWHFHLQWSDWMLLDTKTYPLFWGGLPWVPRLFSKKLFLM